MPSFSLITSIGNIWFVLSIWLNNIKYLTYWSFIAHQHYIPGYTLITDSKSCPEWDLHLVKTVSLSLGLHVKSFRILLPLGLIPLLASPPDPQDWHLVNLLGVGSFMWPRILLLISESQWSHKQLHFLLCWLWSLEHGKLSRVTTPF